MSCRNLHALQSVNSYYQSEPTRHLITADYLLKGYPMVGILPHDWWVFELGRSSSVFLSFIVRILSSIIFLFFLRLFSLVSRTYISRVYRHAGFQNDVLCFIWRLPLKHSCWGASFLALALAGGPPYILYTYLVYHLYTLCIYIYIFFCGPPAMSKTCPPTTMIWSTLLLRTQW